MVLLAPHKNGNKQGRRCDHSTWLFVDRQTMRHLVNSSQKSYLCGLYLR